MLPKVFALDHKSVATRVEPHIESLFNTHNGVRTMSKRGREPSYVEDFVQHGAKAAVQFDEHAANLEKEMKEMAERASAAVTQHVTGAKDALDVLGLRAPSERQRALRLHAKLNVSADDLADWALGSQKTMQYVARGASARPVAPTAFEELHPAVLLSVPPPTLHSLTMPTADVAAIAAGLGHLSLHPRFVLLPRVVYGAVECKVFDTHANAVVHDLSTVKFEVIVNGERRTFEDGDSIEVREFMKFGKRGQLGITEPLGSHTQNRLLFEMVHKTQAAFNSKLHAYAAEVVRKPGLPDVFRALFYPTCDERTGPDVTSAKLLWPGGVRIDANVTELQRASFMVPILTTHAEVNAALQSLGPAVQLNRSRQVVAAQSRRIAVVKGGVDDPSFDVERFRAAVTGIFRLDAPDTLTVRTPQEVAALRDIWNTNGLHRAAQYKFEDPDVEADPDEEDDEDEENLWIHRDGLYNLVDDFDRNNMSIALDTVLRTCVDTPIVDLVPVQIRVSKVLQASPFAVPADSAFAQSTVELLAAYFRNVLNME